MDTILIKDSMVISDMLYILQHFNLNFILYFIVNTVVFYNYCPTSPVRLLWKHIELAWKETIDKLKWNMSGFWKYYQVLSKHWQPSCSIYYSKCSNATSWLGKALFTRVNSFVEALINMVCELKLLQGLKKIV